MVILGHNLGNSQVSVYRTIGPTLVCIRRCPYKVLLQHHCPVSWKQRGDQSSVRKKPVAKVTVARLLTDHIHPRQVHVHVAY